MINNIKEILNNKKAAGWFTSLNIIVAIMLVNIGLTLLPSVKIDLTRDKIHTISASSKEMVMKLDDIVNVKVYQSKNLPSEIRPVADNLKSIIDEFSRLNKLKFLVKYIDPSQDEKYEQEAIASGIQPLQFSIVKEEKLEVSRGYLGVTVSYQDKVEVLPVAGDAGNIEYFLVSSIKKMSAKELGEIGLIDGTKKEGKSKLNYFGQYLSQLYKINVLDTDKDSNIPEKIKSIVIIGQEKKINPKLIESIKQKVESGAGLLVVQSGVNVSDNLEGKKAEDNGMAEILAKYGMSIEPKLVMDDSAAVASFQTRNGSFLSRYPYWITVLSENINRNIPLSSGISALMLPWSSPIRIDGEAEVLILSSKQSFANENIANLSPNVKDDFSGKELNQSVVGAINRKIGKVAVIGNSHFVDDQFLSNSQHNLALGINLIDYVSNDDTLIGIRSKTIGSRALKPMSNLTKQVYRVINIGLPILLIVVISVATIFFRRKANKSK